MSAEVEIPAFYVDAVTFDSFDTGAVPWLAVYNRNPEPGEVQARVDLGFEFAIACDSGDTFSNVEVWVAVGSGPEVRVLELAGPFIEPGWDVEFSGPAIATLCRIVPPTDFPPLTEVTVRLEVETSGGQSLAESWSFTTEDLVAPVLSRALARDSRTVRLTFNEPVSDSALEADAYSFERLNVFPQAAVDVAPVEVARVSSNVVDVTLDLELSDGVLYRVTASGVEDLFENVIGAPDNTATFTGILCVNAPADRRFELWRMLSQKNRDEDATRELEAFFSCLQDVTNLLLCSIDAWTDILDPDRASEIWLDAMLQDLGNPFSFDLDVQEKRRLVSVLVAAYKQKGTAIGIVNLVRLFLGLEVSVIAFNGGGGWELGVDEIGDLELGPSDSAARFSFEVVAAAVLTDDQREMIRVIAEYMKPAHTHLIAVSEPPTDPFVDHVELGLSELGDEFILH